MGLFDDTLELAEATIQDRTRRLKHGRPQTFAESGGSVGQYEWGDQSITQSELKQVKQVRETGGLAAQLFHAKALMRFGTGVELTAESDALQSALRDILPDIDTLALALGEDATFYPYALGELVETNGGTFSHIEPVEPWTTLPETDDHGSVTAWLHHVDRDRELRLEPEDIGHIAITRASGRDKVGISDVLRSQDEIEQYKANQEAINNAIEVAGFPHHVWQVGAEGGTPVSDDELWRYRTLVEGMAGDTQFIVGPDVEHSKITPADFDFAAITERDLRLLTAAIGLPFEIVGYGSDGLGSGHEADLKMNLLKIQNEAARRRFADQFRREFLAPIVARYTEFDAEDETYGIAFDPFLDDKSDMADWINTVSDYMRNEDVVERFDLPPIEDEELASSYRSPRQIEEAEEGDTTQDGPFGGVFSEDRTLADADVPEWEAAYLSMYEHCLWHDDTDRALAGFSESALPEMVTERLREAILGGALFSDFDTIPSNDLADLRGEFAEMLSEDGWTLSEMTDRLQDFEPSLSDSEAERIARTETQHTVSMARKDAYEDRGLADDQFKWTGPDDHRNATFDGVELCRRVAQETDPSLGGTPRTLEELDELLQDVHDELGVGTSYREFTPHINCRHTYVRVVE